MLVLTYFDSFAITYLTFCLSQKKKKIIIEVVFDSL